jgi:hypothetical protein
LFGHNVSISRAILASSSDNSGSLLLELAISCSKAILISVALSLYPLSPLAEGKMQLRLL